MHFIVNQPRVVFLRKVVMSDMQRMSIADEAATEFAEAKQAHQSERTHDARVRATWQRISADGVITPCEEAEMEAEITAEVRVEHVVDTELGEAEPVIETVAITHRLITKVLRTGSIDRNDRGRIRQFQERYFPKGLLPFGLRLLRAAGERKAPVSATNTAEAGTAAVVSA